METELVIIEEYCNFSKIEPQFIISLEKEGLIDIKSVDGNQYIWASQLVNIERYAQWHYDLAINIEGIDAIQRLLSQMETMKDEINNLRKLANLDKQEDSLDFDNDLFN